jgi:phosphatidylglycerophosphate synthase
MDPGWRAGPRASHDPLNDVRATTFSANREALLAHQKPSRGTAAYGRLVNRPAGRLVAAYVHTLGMTPDTATVISALLSTAGIAVLALAEPTWLSGVLVAVLLAFGYVMDSVDGQLARLRRQRSVRGEWLDHTVDCAKTSSLHLAVAISWFRYPPTEHASLLLVPLAYCVVQAVTYFGLIVMPYLRSSRPTAVRAETREHPLRKWLVLPTDYGFLCWTFVLIGSAQLFAAVYTALMLLSAVMLALALRKWWRELTVLDRDLTSD